MPGSCGKADLGTLVLPLFGAAEEGWPPPVRAALYLGAELGGDPKWAKATAALLVMLWLVYVLVSVAIVEGWF